MPRSETSEAVTSKAQRATCTPSKTSRKVNATQEAGNSGAAFHRLHCVSAPDLARRQKTGKNSACEGEKKRHERTHAQSGVTVTWMGNSAIGCQRRQRAQQAQPQSMCPPHRQLSEMRIASVRSWRRILQRVDPMDRRMASSRERSAARAAKMPARFAQAARSTRKARNMIPLRNERAGPPSVSPMRPGLTSRAPIPSSQFGYAREHCRAMALRLSVPCCERHSGFEHAEHKDAMVHSLRQEAVTLHLLFVHHRNPEIRPDKQLRSVEGSWSDTNDGEGMLIEIDGMPMTRGSALKRVRQKASLRTR